MEEVIPPSRTYQQAAPTWSNGKPPERVIELSTDDPPATVTLAALHHFRQTITAERPDFTDWDRWNDDAQRWFQVALVKAIYSDGYRDLAARLREWPSLAGALRFDPEDTPSYATLSRRMPSFDGDRVQDVAQSARNAGLHVACPTGRPLAELPADPRQPRELRDKQNDESVPLSRQMEAAVTLAQRYLTTVSDHLEFDREHSGNFRYPIHSFLGLLGYDALVDIHPNTGARLGEWDIGGLDVPTPETLNKYASGTAVRTHEARSLKATTDLLDEIGCLPEESVDLVFDLSKIPWYGDAENRWTSGGRPERNTSQFWYLAVCGFQFSGETWLLAATPIQHRSHKTTVLRRVIRLIRRHLPATIRRMYFDRQFYSARIVELCRKYDIDALIQAKRQGEVKRLIKEADGVERTSVQLGQSNVHGTSVAAFTVPLSPQEVGFGGRDDDQTAWITTCDTSGRDDLRSLAHKSRRRWRVETAIRDLKNTFLSRCGSGKKSVRAFYSSVAVLLYNIWKGHRKRLPVVLNTNVELTATESLRATVRASSRL